MDEQLFNKLNAKPQNIFWTEAWSLCRRSRIICVKK